MVDTKDLKSFGHYGCAGSSPASGTEMTDNYLIIGHFFVIGGYAATFFMGEFV